MLYASSHYFKGGQQARTQFEQRLLGLKLLDPRLSLEALGKERVPPPLDVDVGVAQPVAELRGRPQHGRQLLSAAPRRHTCREPEEGEQGRT
eukprot:2697478-Pleurochrysis_carterae.AAC.1